MPMIMVVEDEYVVAAMLQRMLESAGHTVLLAANGRDALVRIAEQRPDLILSDVMMPFMNGFDLCRTLQADPHYRTIPILLMSSGHDPLLAAGSHAGAMLEKPFGRQRLLDLIGQTLDREGDARMNH